MTNIIYGPAQTNLISSLTNGVQGSRHLWSITWKVDENTAYNLTGATLTATIQNVNTEEVADSTGALALVTAASGTFTWRPSADDIGTAGQFAVMFRAAISGITYAAFPASWVVIEDPEATTTFTAGLVGISTAAKTWLTAEQAGVEAVADGNLLQSDGTNSEDSGIVAANVLQRYAGIVSVSTGRDLATSDNGKVLECNGTFAVNCPNGLDAGFQVALVNVGSGVITITATTTLQSKDAAVTITNQYAAATLYHRGSNIWLLAGDIA